MRDKERADGWRGSTLPDRTKFAIRHIVYFFWCDAAR